MFPLTAQEKAEVVTICDHLRQLKFSQPSHSHVLSKAWPRIKCVPWRACHESCGNSQRTWA